MNAAIRAECYKAIRDAMKSRVLKYYQVHPELLGDERSQRAIKESMEGLKAIFEVLDRYTLSPRQGK